MPGKGQSGIDLQLGNQLAQHIHVQIEIAGGVHRRDTAFSHQLYRLELELPAELSSLHRTLQPHEISYLGFHGTSSSSGILDAATRERLVVFARTHRQGAAGPDEEQFRLLTGFNDIFVTIAIRLLLFTVGALGSAVTPMLSAVGVAAAAWGLAEYFTWQRRTALPSIVLVLAFVALLYSMRHWFCPGPCLTLV